MPLYEGRERKELHSTKLPQFQVEGTFQSSHTRMHSHVHTHTHTFTQVSSFSVFMLFYWVWQVPHWDSGLIGVKRGMGGE